MVKYLFTAPQIFVQYLSKLLGVKYFLVPNNCSLSLFYQIFSLLLCQFGFKRVHCHQFAFCQINANMPESVVGTNQKFITWLPEPDQDSLLFFCNARPFHDNPDCLVGLVPLARAGMNHAGGAQLSTPAPLCSTTTTCQFSPTGSHLLLLTYFYLPSLPPTPPPAFLPAWQAGHICHRGHLASWTSRRSQAMYPVYNPFLHS